MKLKIGTWVKCREKSQKANQGDMSSKSPTKEHIQNHNEITSEATREKHITRNSYNEHENTKPSDLQSSSSEDDNIPLSKLSNKRHKYPEVNST